MNIVNKTKAVVKMIKGSRRPAAWIAYLLFMLLADDQGRYQFVEAGPKRLQKLADKIPMLGVWPSVSDLLTRTTLLEKQEIIATLPEIVGLDMMQLQADLRLLAHRLAKECVEKDGRGRSNLDEIGRVLAKINQEVIESPQNSNSSAPADKQQ